jgi:hypothetical protein
MPPRPGALARRASFRSRSWAGPAARSAAGRCERGAVTAETAMVLPLLVALTGMLAWLLSLGVAQVRTVDAAREAARALARGESQEAAVALGRQVAGSGTRFSVIRQGQRVTVTAVSPVAGPGGPIGDVVGTEVRAVAVAAAEDEGR